jgi:hypothetical protein
MNTLGVYLVHSKTQMLVLSAGFCRRVADWSIYNTFMLTSEEPIENREGACRRFNFN